MQTLVDFHGDPCEPHWVVVNDGVMGGRSSGELHIEHGSLRFSGMLSLDRNGGFSSVRTVDFVADLSDFSAVVLRVLGDGRHYQLRLQTDAEIRGIRVSYGAEFNAAAGKWAEVRIGFNSLQPSVRGTLLKEPPFNPSMVRQIGVLIADKREGPFLLSIDWIAVE